MFLLFKSEEAGCTVCGQNGVVWVCTHAFGIALNGIIILSIFEKRVTLRKQENQGEQLLEKSELNNQFVYGSV